MSGVRADIVQLHPYRVRDGAVEHLVLRRAAADDLCPGAWQVVTGACSDGESALDAAQRELREETGLTTAVWEVTGRVATFYFAPLDAVVLSPIVACELPPDAAVALSLEHQEHRWLCAADAVATLTFDSQREGVRIVEELALGASA